MTLRVSSAKTKSRLLRLLVLVYVCATLFGGQHICEAALTLERPGVDVDWNRIPSTTANEAPTHDTTTASAPPRQTAPAEVKYGTSRLFGTVEIKSKMKNMPQWERVLRSCSGKTNLIENALKKSGRTRELQTWNSIRAAASNPPGMETIKAVNAFFNQWPYRTDMEVYGVIDYWGTPDEFIKNSGDCDCYSVTKFFALIDLGYPPEKLRIIVLKDTIRNLDHAVVGVYLGDEVYILDNMTNQVNTHERFRYYMPQLSMDQVYRWAHLPAKK
jgi:predicted transglutaminase-like cysteine proteinase